MELNLERVRAGVKAASTADLLDRATIFRAGMEPEALAIIDEELYQRGVTASEIHDHAERLRAAVLEEDGVALRCRYCDRPAVTRGWRWQRLWGVLPLFPRRVALCEVHAALV
jgi:hypothetical protein